MCRKLRPILTLCLVASGCAHSSRFCADGAGSNCGIGYHATRLFRPLACGSGCCGEVYWGEWISDPPDCADPCDNCGTYVGPRSRVWSSLTWCNLWGQRNGSCDRGSCSSCIPTACDCGDCESGTSTFDTWNADEVDGGTRVYQFQEATPLWPSVPPVDQVQFHRPRRGKSLFHLSSRKGLEPSGDIQRVSAKQPTGFRE